MQENENNRNFLSRIKEMKDKFGDIGERISSTDFIIVTLHGMLDKY
jgi:hypothetical protein